jgi:hypothetical protein
MRVHIALTALILVAAAGCSGNDFPETYPVTGTVTYRGSPVEGATVILVPSDPALRSASGVTDAEGKFSVATYFDPRNQPAGAMSGDYAVTVSKVEAFKAPEGAKREEIEAAFVKAGPPKTLLPKAYQSPETSGFQVKVDSASPEPLSLDLQDKG